MKNYAVLLLVPAAMAGAWYVGSQVVLAPAQAVADVPKYGLSDLPAVSTERVRRTPVAFHTGAFGIRRALIVAPLPVTATVAVAVAAPAVRAVSVLQAVLIDGDRRIAQIDGSALREGGLVGRRRVAHIEARRVKLVSLDGGQVSWLALDEAN
jgi:hypothetical protein